MPDLKIEEDMLKLALRLIKLHIGPEETKQNRELHQAIQLIVTVARQHNLLAH